MKEKSLALCHVSYRGSLSLASVGSRLSKYEVECLCASTTFSLIICFENLCASTSIS
jgi:hypothetical protein